MSLGFPCPWGYILPESLTNVEKQRNFDLPVLSFPWHAERCRYNRIRILWRKGGNCVLKTLDSWVSVNGSNFFWGFILCLQEIQSCRQADDRVLHKLMLWGEKKYSSHLYWLRWWLHWAYRLTWVHTLTQSFEGSAEEEELGSECTWIDPAGG